MTEKTLEDALREIEAGAKDVRTAGTEVSNRIKSFEAWLNKLPGKTATSHKWWEAPDGSSRGYLSFAKDGSTWSLYVEEYDEREEGYTRRVPLRDASLEEKIDAIAAFPALIREMVESQRLLVTRLVDAKRYFDVFAKSVGIKEGA